MKKAIATAAAIAVLSSTAALAGETSKMKKNDVFVSTMQETATSSGGVGLILPLMILVMVAAAVAHEC